MSLAHCRKKGRSTWHQRYHPQEPVCAANNTTGTFKTGPNHSTVRSLHQHHLSKDSKQGRGGGEMEELQSDSKCSFPGRKQERHW